MNTYPRTVTLIDDRGTCRARVTTTLNGHIILRVSRRAARRFNGKPPAAPAPFGGWFGWAGEPDLSATYGTEHSAAVIALQAIGR